MPKTLDQLTIDRSVAPRRQRRWLKPVLLGGFALVLLLSIAIALSKQSLEVETTRATLAWPAQSITQLNATGYVVADRKAAVASKGTGRLEALEVREGSIVKAGDLIGRLENTELRAQLAQAHANVEAAIARQRQLEADRLDAQLNMQRQQELANQKFVSPAAVDAANSRYHQAAAAVRSQEATVRVMRAAVDNAAAALDNTIIRAPFAGVILTKQANVGDIVAPFNANADSKGAVVTMADLSTLEVEADVAETNLAKAHVGQPCEIQLDALPDRRLLGTVSRIVPTVDRSKATVKFKITFNETNPRVLPEMSARVAFLDRPLQANERQPRLAISPEAVREGHVFVIIQGKAQLRPVKTGSKIGDLIEVLSGLKAGDTLILNPSSKIQNGAAVVEKKK